MPASRSGKAGRPMRPSWLLPALIVTLATGAIMLACAGPCFAADIQPPTDEQAEEFLENVKSGEYALVFGESPDDPPYKVVKTEKVTQVEKREDGTAFVAYYMYVIYTVSVKTRYDNDLFTDVYEDHALLYSMTWVAGTDQPLEQSINAGTDSKIIEVPPGEYGSAMDQAVAAMEASLQEELSSFDHVSGWVAVSSSGEIIASPESETKAEGSNQAEGGSKIPGPGSWWQWLTGTVIAGIIATVIGLINAIFGAVPPVPVVPATGAFPPEPPPTDIAGGSVDPFSRIPARPPDIPQGLEPPPGVSKVDIAIDTVINIAEDITQWEHITNPSDYIKEKTDALGKEIIDTARKETDLPIYEDALKKTAKDIENIINIPENEAYVAWENIKEYIRNNERIQNIKDGIAQETEIFQEGMRMTGEDIDRLSKVPGEKIEEGLKKAGEALDDMTDKLGDTLGGKTTEPPPPEQ